MKEGALKVDMRSKPHKSERIQGFYHLFLFNDIMIVSRPTPSDKKPFAHVRTLLLELCEPPEEYKGNTLVSYKVSLTNYRDA